MSALLNTLMLERTLHCHSQEREFHIHNWQPMLPPGSLKCDSDFEMAYKLGLIECKYGKRKLCCHTSKIYGA